MPLLTAPAVEPGTLSSQPQPVLGAGAVVLRPFRPNDSDLVVRGYADPEIQRWHVRSVTAEESTAWIYKRQLRWQAESGADWAISAGGEFVGRMGLCKLDLEEGVGEVTYWLLPEHRGRGHASAALTILTDWAFTLGLGRLELVHSVQNAPSCRVAEHAGYLLEGVKRHAGLHADGWHDMHLHARVAAPAPRPS